MVICICILDLQGEVMLLFMTRFNKKLNYLIACLLSFHLLHPLFLPLTISKQANVEPVFLIISSIVAILEARNLFLRNRIINNIISFPIFRSDLIKILTLKQLYKFILGLHQSSPILFI